ncbi:Tim44 domain-containing protein [Pigmentiphaga aceris]|uniref:Tim44 domain-containing protein n=1 Tax=Pigmentiphaga aceris TaxID=1940612 RepID=A0A5C0B2X6_9BURK|nr:TIM44-like domain-containing protein [Pigmentiphaga aceris]QEI08615.1 Tim44 domain-containing protein [Pigmentiphaga aceris]
MSRGFFSRVLPAALIVVSTLAMTAVSYDAQAKRLGGGGSSGRQSSNVMQRQATPPAGAPGAASSAAAPAAAGATAGAAAGAARSGASRWLGPVAGIAAGLGLAALFSSMGLGGALAEFMSSFLLIGLLAFAAIFIFRKLRGAKPANNGAQPAFQGAGAQKTGGFDPIGDRRAAQGNNLQREAAPVAAASAANFSPAANGLPAGTSEVAAGATWAIPADFDTAGFLQHAKRHFVELQKIWDRGDTAALRDYVTDDMLAELTQQMSQRTGTNVTEVVLLNAELMGIETLSDGYLASVRFSGMVREEVGAEATRLEEVWNLYKPTNGGGWLLAGLQQL